MNSTDDLRASASDADLDEYILNHISPEPQMLRQLYRDTYLHRLYPRMCSGHLQGRLLTMLTQMIRPRRIIELGTFTGYSTLCFAEGMPAEAELHTIEIDDEFADELRLLFDSSPWGHRMHLHIGDALEIIPNLESGWDLAFIDANKRHYIDYYEALVPRMRPGGFIFADNTLWSDKVLSPGSNTDAQSRAICQFNDHVAADPRIEKVILPLRDGMTLIRVLP